MKTDYPQSQFRKDVEEPSITRWNAASLGEIESHNYKGGIYILSSGLLATELTSQLHWTDPPGILPRARKAGLIDVEWAIKDFTKSEVQQSWCNVVRHPLKVLLQAFSSVPGGSGFASFLQL